MEETKHLSDESWAAVLASELDAASQAHLEGCGTCRAEERALRSALDGARESLSAAAERSEIFWIRQRAEINARIREQRAGHHRLAWATAVAFVVLAASLLLRPVPRREPAPLATVSDQELLMQVESSLSRDVPEALSPSDLITQELAEASQKKLNNEKGESK
ncbi:MAG: hypothetical protein ACRD4K_02835 [Candidatus Acidiferrales bacterium]